VTEGTRGEETNYEEAAAKAHLAFVSSVSRVAVQAMIALHFPPPSRTPALHDRQSVDDVMRELLDDGRADTIAADTPHFWVVVRALRDFVAANGELPLSGEVPDMTATTEQYLRLQRVFVDKAAEDRADMRARVAALAASAGMPADAIPVALVDRACKNARFLRCFRLHSLASEHALDERTKE